MSNLSTGTSSLGGLTDLLDPDFDTSPPTNNPSRPSSHNDSKPAGQKKRPLMNDDEDEDDEDEEVDVDDDSEDDYGTPQSTKHNNDNNKSPTTSAAYNSPRRRTRSCAVPDVLKTKEVVTLDDLMKHNILRPGIINYCIHKTQYFFIYWKNNIHLFTHQYIIGDTLEFSGLGNSIETGILVKDGWIEYGTDKFPDMDAWVVRVFKDHKRRRKSMDCWETVSARSHALSYHRDQFLNKMNNRPNYNERKKRLREEKRKKAGGKPKHAVPGRNRLAQQESTQPHSTSAGDEDEEVLIDDEPTTNKEEIVLPHKKRKIYSKHEAANEEKQYVPYFLPFLL